MKDSLESLLDIQKIYQKKLQTLAKKHHLTISEWRILQQIQAGQNTQALLAAESDLDVSTLSRQIARLVNKGYLDIEKLAAQQRYARRINAYHLNDLGATQLTNMNQDFQKLSQIIFSHWGDEEKNLLKILLNRLEKSLIRSLEA
ncbi:MarR family winged helix-turn-helix transcriptional regulator [Ligilactobacillus ceti]|uniref:MarR family winged helix-turn-helix transcriptional regulator n=1 Tax=Ligilactobacillus ceti TaxID=395085 RepID=UPI00040DB704|nr:MarR family winged helix-turn-helix transcriptional regulator [Ligilactobacillus ceti]